MRKSTKRTATTVAANVPAIVETIAATDAATIETVLPVLDTNEITDGAAAIIDNATGETVQPETATEAKPDPRAAKAERIAADRAAVAKLYASFERNRLSVPVKPLSAFKLATSSAHPIARNVSQRQCAALAVAFTAAGVQLAAGAKAARVFTLDDKPVAIENGVLRDAISSGLCTVTGETPESEIITLSKTATASITGQLGAPLLKAAGIIA